MKILVLALAVSLSCAFSSCSKSLSAKIFGAKQNSSCRCQDGSGCGCTTGGECKCAAQGGSCKCGS